MADGAKTWVFTLNNWTEPELDNILHWEVNQLTVAEEVAPDTGTPHLQGCVTFKRKYRLGALKKMMARAHWEAALAADAHNYPQKDGQKVHRVDNRRQGKRSDLDDAKEYAAARKRPREFIAEKASSWTAVKSYGLLYDMFADPRPIEPIDVRWYHGPTGSGKTRAVFTEFPEVYRVLSDKWWDGYDGQKVVVIDDIRADWCSFRRLLQLTDIYPFRVEIKGSSREVQYTTIIITAPFPPEEFPHGDEDIQQLLRRVTTVRRFE